MECAWKALLAVLPPWLAVQVDKQQGLIQEIRLRLGANVLLIQKEGNKSLAGCVTREDLHHIVNKACRYSPWTVASMAQGFITIEGGHRIGLCGEALIRNGQMVGLREVTSINIRICRDFSGICGNLWLRNESMLLLGPPGSGKTTLLRDLIRQRARRETIAVVDERGEIFPDGAHFFQGEHTDVLTGCRKDQGIERMLRVMGPQCIAVDEITAQSDCDGLIQAGKCGVSVLATAHGASISDLRHRPIYEKLVASGLFETVVILQMDKSWRTERMVL